MIGSRAIQAATSSSLAVAGGVVGVGVRLHPVGVRLDQLRALAGAGLLDRVAEHGEQRGHVVAVDPLAGHAVADALVRQRRRDGLAGQRHGDRVLVVLHEEDDRRVEDRGEVERLVEVALAGGAVAAHRHHDGVLALEPRRVRDPDGVRCSWVASGVACGRDLVLVGVVAASASRP